MRLTCREERREQEKVRGAPLPLRTWHGAGLGPRPRIPGRAGLRADPSLGGAAAHLGVENVARGVAERRGPRTLVKEEVEVLDRLRDEVRVLRARPRVSWRAACGRVFPSFRRSELVENSHSVR